MLIPLLLIQFAIPKRDSSGVEIRKRKCKIRFGEAWEWGQARVVSEYYLAVSNIT